MGRVINVTKSAIQNRRGFSLVQVMVTMGISTILIYSISQSLLNSVKMENAVRLGIEARSFELAMQREIQGASECGISDLKAGKPITVKNWDGKTEYSLKDSTIDGIFFSIKEGGTYNDLLSIDKIDIAGYSDGAMDPKYAAVGTTSADDFVNATTIIGSISFRVSGTSSVAQMRPIRVPIQLGLSTDGSEIISCEAMQNLNSLEETCVGLGWQWNYEANECEASCPQTHVRNEEGACVDPSVNSESGVVFHCLPDANNCGVSALYTSF